MWFFLYIGVGINPGSLLRKGRKGIAVFSLISQRAAKQAGPTGSITPRS
jgi:hypothetical protein